MLLFVLILNTLLFAAANSPMVCHMSKQTSLPPSPHKHTFTHMSTFAQLQIFLPVIMYTTIRHQTQGPQKNVIIFITFH